MDHHSVMTRYDFAMSEARPVLMLLVPADWEADPAALSELRRFLSDEYGAVLSLRQSSVPMRSPLPLHVGYWPRELRDGAGLSLRPLIDAAFFSLSWLELDEVG